jgi:hypothetical protein
VRVAARPPGRPHVTLAKVDPLQESVAAATRRVVDLDSLQRGVASLVVRSGQQAGRRSR